MLTLRSAMAIVLAALTVLGPGVVCGQNYPNKPIRLVAPAAGGGGDFTARLVAQGISGPLGQPVIVDNRGAPTVATEILLKAPPDGYTLYAGGGGFWTTTLLRKMPYDVVRDFTPISLIVREVLVVTVNPSVPAKSIKELIALAKARPGVLNYGSSGIGNATHLSAELFKSLAGVNIVHAPYKGVSAALTGLINGEIQLLITDMGNVAPHIKSGKVRALAITTAEASALAPGLPTVTASGLPGYESLSITGIFALAGTPEPIVKRLNQEMVRFVRTAEAKEKFLAYSQEAVGSSPEEFAATVKSEIAKLGKVIKDAAIKAD